MQKKANYDMIYRKNRFRTILFIAEKKLEYYYSDWALYVEEGAIAHIYLRCFLHERRRFC